MEEWVSISEFARRRGVVHSAVQKAIADGRVPSSSVRRDELGRLAAIEYYSGMRAWNETTDPAQAARTGSGPVAPAAAPGAAGMSEPAHPRSAEKGEGEPAAAVPVEKDHGYYEARARREQIQAQQAELEYLEQLGAVIPAEEQRSVSQRRYRAMRDQLLNIPDRVATIVAAERDPARVHVLLTQEIKRVLHELSDNARAEAAGRLEERVAP